MDEFWCAEAIPRLSSTGLGPQVLDEAGEALDLRGLRGVDTVSELVPDLGAAVDRLVELGSDFSHGSHTVLNASHGGVIPPKT